MSRRHRAEKRHINPDSKYNDVVVAKFINAIMLDGEKSIAEKVLYEAFDYIKEKTGEEPLNYFKKALENVKPKLEVKSRRVGGATYQVPIEVRPERQQTLAIRWLMQFARARKSDRTIVAKISGELMDAYNERGGSVKKKEDTHKMAEANRAFAHYRW